MSPVELKTHARRVPEELLTQGDLPVIDELFAPDCGHRTPLPLSSGAAGARQWVTTLRRAFRDLHALIDDEVAEGMTVVQRLTLTGVHDGPYLETPASGRRVSWPVIDILCAGDDGRFTEHWSMWDQLGLLRQLGGAKTAPEEE
ncbi:MAG: ester cyclase [Chloroflexota bacterium]|nr:ester cyclase [Chloroflexota bacterium]